LKSSKVNASELLQLRQQQQSANDLLSAVKETEKTVTKKINLANRDEVHELISTASRNVNVEREEIAEESDMSFSDDETDASEEEKNTSTNTSETLIKKRERHLSAWNLFYSENKNHVTSSSTNEEFGRTSKVLARTWKNLPGKEKEIYKERAKVEEVKKKVQPVASAEKCQLCGKEYKARKNLKRHHKEVHEKEKRKSMSIECSECSNSFSTKSSLNRHVKQFH